MIYYFTGTGNSRYVAEKLREALKQEVTYIPDINGPCICSDEMIGIISPVYFYGIPKIVRDFISRCEFTNTKKVFSVLTYGASPENASRILKRELKKKGIGLTHTFEIKMPETYVSMFRVPAAIKQDLLFYEADEHLKKIPALLEKDKYTDRTHLLGFMMSGIVAPFFRNGIKTERFKMNGKCTGCSECAALCPDKVISMKDGGPEWAAGRCTGCLACVHRCPSAAIEIGRSKDHGRYVNTHVKF